MPLTTKGRKIMASMQREYGAKRGERVFYASRNAGRITGVDPESSGRSGLDKAMSAHADKMHPVRRR